ncbi:MULTISPECIES: bifunctional 3'-5' exonuclease/DNA polymerase [Rhodococcus]|uniref:DNA-directed DNA polymerase n=1 Tax=Rhodococcus cerastii TaxID=908616 RepID=A0ABU4CVK6_9NOCA|nr:MULTISPECIES: bifunctional 3'-5' exonuclease/DNA polymerase [Rhodococcus]MDV6301491.1 bifunctional 3'-5' exonuclease/DNA polymerase [Rhodococcus cerastii]MDV7987950.1 bifunctional 3'-5' exonuclease/DNA polymerase [Rhodococcus sp. IEGM 1374]
MKVLLVPQGEQAVLTHLADDGSTLSDPTVAEDIVAAVAELERDERPMWVWEDTSRIYPRLLERGVRVRRCHDLALVGAILSMRAGSATVPSAPADLRPGLFDANPNSDPAAVLAEYRRQLRDVGDDRALNLLAAAESAGGLAAAEMTFDGLPFSASAHRRHLETMLGTRPLDGSPPPALVELENQISSAFGRRVNPASPVELVSAFARVGIELTSTRAHTIRDIDHPAVPLLLRHRDLSKLHAANGWAWLDAWVRDDRFRPVYVPGAVVSGRWASRGGGGLQIPKPLRASVIADPGHTFVAADAGQLEPRILAAMSGDPRMVAAAGTADLYAPVAAESFDGDRAHAKVAVLGVLYGATSGDARALLTRLRAKFPGAVALVEEAARAGERGEVVRSWLGRACPPPSVQWWSTGDAHARGRFTRNFVVQATAAEWALCLLADLRGRLAGSGARRSDRNSDEGSGARRSDQNSGSGSELVFFQHDEVVVHCAIAESGRVAEAIAESALSATRLMFGDTAVRFPMETRVDRSYGASAAGSELDSD